MVATCDGMADEASRILMCAGADRVSAVRAILHRPLKFLITALDVIKNHREVCKPRTR